MSKVLVVALGVGGWAGAIALLVKLRHTTLPSPVSMPGVSTWDRARVLVSRGSGGLAGSVVAGVLVIGLGGRLMMRVVAATSADAVQGAITDMEAEVGKVTVGGTVGFVLFVGVGAGILAWIGRLALRRWMPDRSLTAGLLAAGIGAGLLARPSGLLNPESIDFFIVTPQWLAVGLIVGLIATFAMLSIVLSDRWSQTWPTVHNAVSVVWLVPLALLVFLPPLAVGLAAITLVRARAGEIDDTVTWVAKIDRIGRFVVGFGAVVGASWTLLAAVEIVRG